VLLDNSSPEPGGDGHDGQPPVDFKGWILPRIPPANNPKPVPAQVFAFLTILMTLMSAISTDKSFPSESSNNKEFGLTTISSPSFCCPSFWVIKSLAHRLLAYRFTESIIKEKTRNNDMNLLPLGFIYPSLCFFEMKNIS